MYAKKTQDRILHPVLRYVYVFNRNGFAYISYKSTKESLHMTFSKANSQLIIRAMNEYIRKKEQYLFTVQGMTLYTAFIEYMKLFEGKMSRQNKTLNKCAIKTIFTEDIYLTEVNKINKAMTAFLKSPNWSQNTKHHYSAKIKKFLNWCILKKYIVETGIPEELVPPRYNKDVDFFATEEINLMNEYFKIKDRNFYLFLRILQITAFRVGSLIKLTWDDVKENEIVIVHKTNYRFPLGLFPELQEILDELRKEGNKRLFRHSYSLYHYKLTKGLKELGFNYDYKFHAFRKYTDNMWDTAGISIEVRAKLLGNSVVTEQRNYNAKPKFNYFRDKISGQVLSKLNSQNI